VTERVDLYIGAVVTLMFLAGCFLVVVGMRERFKERRRERVWTAAEPRQKASHL
jgi:hypothetical protein